MTRIRLDWIIIFSVLTLAFASIKYTVPQNMIPSSFLMMDLMAFFFLLVCIYLYLTSFKTRKEQEQIFSEEINRLTHKFHLENETLIKKIKEYEDQNAEDEKGLVTTKLIIADLQKILNKEELNSSMILSILAKYYEISCGIIYKLETSTNLFIPIGRYAIENIKDIPSLEKGVGLGGQVIEQQESRVIESLPGDYLLISSGLGKSTPCFLHLIPIINDDLVIGLMEIASFKRLKVDLFWSQLNPEIANILAKL